MSALFFLKIISIILLFRLTIRLIFDKIYKAKISKTSLTEQKETGMKDCRFLLCQEDCQKIIRREERWDYLIS